MARNGLVLTLAPTLLDWPAFAQAAQPIAITVTPEGVLLANVGGAGAAGSERWALRPSLVADPQGADGFAQDADGTLRFGRQRLLPAFADYAAARALVLDALPGAQVQALLQPEGALGVVLPDGSRWQLLPGAQLLPARTGPQGQPWWLGEDGALYLRQPQGVQRVGVRPE